MAPLQMGRGTRRCYGFWGGGCFRTVTDGNTYGMPKVDPTTGNPMSDAPDGDLDTRGGKMAGEPGMEGATETGRQGVGYSETGSRTEEDDKQLQAEKGGNAGAGQGGFS
jgi:hypothetical protein